MKVMTSVSVNLLLEKNLPEELKIKKRYIDINKEANQIGLLKKTYPKGGDVNPQKDVSMIKYINKEKMDPLIKNNIFLNLNKTRKTARKTEVINICLNASQIIRL